jgi:hypothetical protein
MELFIFPYDKEPLRINIHVHLHGGHNDIVLLARMAQWLERRRKDLMILRRGFKSCYENLYSKNTRESDVHVKN